MRRQFFEFVLLNVKNGGGLCRHFEEHLDPLCGGVFFAGPRWRELLDDSEESPYPILPFMLKQRSTRRQTLITFSNLPHSSAIKPTLTHIRVHWAAVRFPDRRVAQRVSRPVARGCCRATVRQQRPPCGRVPPLRLHRRRPPPVRIQASFFEQGLEVAAVLHGVAICTMD
jgi:hypothetical protein